MNPLCAAPEMSEVQAELLLRVSRSICVCGAPKGATRPFCGVCWRRLHAIDQSFVPSARFSLFNPFATTARSHGLWLYDLCCDLLRDPNLGLIRKPKQTEDH